MGFGFLFSLKMPHWIRHVCHSPTPPKKSGTSSILRSRKSPLKNTSSRIRWVRRVTRVQPVASRRWGSNDARWPRSGKTLVLKVWTHYGPSFFFSRILWTWRPTTPFIILQVHNSKQNSLDLLSASSMLGSFFKRWSSDPWQLSVWMQQLYQLQRSTTYVLCLWNITEHLLNIINLLFQIASSTFTAYVFPYTLLEIVKMLQGTLRAARPTQKTCTTEQFETHMRCCKGKRSKGKQPKRNRMEHISYIILRMQQQKNVRIWYLHKWCL